MEFREAIMSHYRSGARSFPWRDTRDPYAILVSEFMLQQTQTDRVVPKYLAWLAAFPTVQDLASAELA
ncbi:MAG TPA: A/G-specific adenine glycosylase, partial [Treponemataceae bacterium]|nr:A/G-specific adenine glycosylase [Treponemataceae bacterium]